MVTNSCGVPLLAGSHFD